MGLPKVSILIPVYNRENYITSCIDSARKQSYRDIEIIVVDNNSSDRTWDICKEHASLDSRVKIFRNSRNVGPVRNWVRCIDEAQGQYCKILFSDDLLEPECVADMLEGFSGTDVGFVFSAVRIGTSLNSSRVEFGLSEDTIFSCESYFRLLIGLNAPFSPGAILIRRDDLRKNLLVSIPSVTSRCYEENGAGPDVMISLLTAVNYKNVVGLAKPLVFFREHAGSFSVENENQKVRLGYVSAIAYFFWKYGFYACWLDYLGGSWVRNMLIKRSWIPPNSYAVAHEGKGTSFEAARPILAGMKFIGLQIFGTLGLKKSKN